MKTEDIIKTFTWYPDEEPPETVPLVFITDTYSIFPGWYLNGKTYNLQATEIDGLPIGWATIPTYDYERDRFFAEA